MSESIDLISSLFPEEIISFGSDSLCSTKLLIYNVPVHLFLQLIRDKIQNKHCVKYLATKTKKQLCFVLFLASQAGTTKLASCCW